MSELEDLRDAVLIEYVDFRELMTRYVEPTRLRLLDEARDRLASGRFHVVVCGEFRRGKSSLLNALVERPGMFPVDADITTCAVLTLQWDAKEWAVVYFAPGDPDRPESVRQPLTVGIGQVGEYVTEQGNPGNDKHVLRVEMNAPVEQLKSGLVFSDTPGLGSMNPGHRAATVAALYTADAVLFVASAVQPLSVVELEILRLALERRPVVVTALTMIDRVVNPAPVVAEARARIAAEVGVAAGDLVVVPVSAHRKRDAMEDGEDDLLAASGFPELEAEVWGGLAATCGKARLGTSLDAMSTALDEAESQVQNTLDGLRNGWQKVDDELREQQKLYQRLTSDSHTWKRDLQTDVDQAARRIQDRLEDAFDGIRDDFRDALRPDTMPHKPERLVRRLSDDMIDAVDHAGRGLEAEMERIADKYAALTELGIKTSGAASSGMGEFRVSTAPREQVKKHGYARFREMWLGGTAGAGAGGLLGAIGGPVGAAAGAVVGFFVGVFQGRKHQKRNAEDEARRRYVADLRDRVLPKLNSARSRAVRDFQQTVRDYTRGLIAALEDETKAKGESLAASVKRLKEARERDAKDRPAQEKELRDQLAELAQARMRLDGLRRSADGL